jgi:hypothetical protein
MLNKISQITGYRFDVNEENVNGLDLLRRIADKIPADVTPESRTFELHVLAAQASADGDGQRVMSHMADALVAEPAPKVLKIKSSPKGARIKIAASNGVRYSFGPIWNASIVKGKGIALVEANREKLNHQALMLGLTAPEKMKLDVLVGKLAPLVA